MKKLLLSTVAFGILASSQLSAMTAIINGEKWESVLVSTVNEAGLMNKIVNDLGEQLLNNRNFKNISDNRIAITSFVPLNDFSNTSKVGNILTENLIHELQVRGFTVVDFKTMDSINIKNDGDYIFSRDTDKLRKEYNINLVLSGTCTHYKRGAVVNARIINMEDHSVVSSAQVWIPKRLINKIIPPEVKREVEIVEKETVPSVKKHSVKIKKCKYSK